MAESKHFIMFCLIPLGTDRNPAASPRMFISPMKCRESLHLQENKDYLIWGLSADMWPTKDTYVFHFIDLLGG